MASVKHSVQEPYNLLKARSLSWFPLYLEPSAWIEHIPFAFWLIEEYKPKAIIELGVYNGTSYFSFCQALESLNLNAKAYGIDSWKGDQHAGFYDDNVYKRVSEYNETNYSKFSTLIRSTFDEARPYFTDATIDLLHIDGFHTYDAVKHDFETWRSVLSKNAIVIFHDINVREREFGVFKYWDELKKDYPYFEFDYGFGLGVLAMGEGYSPILQSLFNDNKNSEYYSILKNLFAEHGHFFKKSLDFLFLKNEADLLRHNYQKSEEEKQAIQQELLLIQSQFENNLKALDTSLLELKEVSVIAETKSQQVASFISELNEYRNIFTFYTDTVSKLQNELETLTTENNLFRKKNMRLQLFTKRQQEESGKVAKELEDKTSKLNEAIKKCTEESLYKEQLHFSNELTKEQLLQSKHLNKELDFKVAGLQNRISEQSLEIQRQENSIHDFEIKIQDLRSLEQEQNAAQIRLLEKIDSLETEKKQLTNQIKNNDDCIEELTKELLLSNKHIKMKSVDDSVRSKLNEKFRQRLFRILDRFPRFSFFIKKNLLLLKWGMEGTAKSNKYKIDFWKTRSFVPYELIDDYIAIHTSGLFDTEWYLATYPDVKEDNADPILHYLVHGFFEGRNPGPQFNTLQYLNGNDDVRRASVNALLHYIYNGKKEGRRIYNVKNNEDSSFPYPSSLVSALEIQGQENSNNTQLLSANAQTAEDMPIVNEPDFFKRSFLKKERKPIPEIKKIAFIAQPEYFSFHYSNVFDDMYEVGYFQNSFSEDPAFFNDLVAFDADINIFFRGELVPEEVLVSLSGIRVALSSEPFPKIVNHSVIYTEDSLNRFEFFLRIFEKNYDYIFHYDEISKQFFENQGIQLSGYFPFPIATECINPELQEAKWDMFFSGRTTPHRDKYFGPLKRDFNFLHINHGVVGADLLDFIKKCKVSLNVHAENEISWEPRTQFLMAAGSLLISEPLSPTCPLRPGIDFIEVNDASHAYETCKQVIQNYDAYKHIAENGRKRIEEVLSSRKNFPIFFTELLSGKYKPASFNRNSLKLNPLKTNLKYNGFEHLLTEILHEHA